MVNNHKLIIQQLNPSKYYLQQTLYDLYYQNNK